MLAEFARPLNLLGMQEGWCCDDERIDLLDLILAWPLEARKNFCDVSAIRLKAINLMAQSEKISGMSCPDAAEADDEEFHSCLSGYALAMSFLRTCTCTFSSLQGICSMMV